MWQANGVSVVPIITKNKPLISWKPYQASAPTLDEINDWWGNGHPYGIAIICGAVSGNLEMTEIEARALTSESLSDIADAAERLGCFNAWNRIMNGYTQHSPSGGLHTVYRILDHEVPGNEKIARDEVRYITDENGHEKREQLVFAETRGEGGYFVGAPSPGNCHPSGEPWLLASGSYGKVPFVSWAERNLIHQAIREALDKSSRGVSSLHNPDVPVHVPDVPPHLPPGNQPSTALALVPSSTPVASSGTSPGSDWMNQTDWAQILEPAGWTLHSRMGEERLWTRPGKHRRDGHSASTGYAGLDNLYVWSTSAGFDTEVPLSKLFVYANLSFNGDMSAAAKHLAYMGYGDRPRQPVPAVTEGELPDAQMLPSSTPTPFFTLDDMGNGQRLWHHVKDRCRYVYEEKTFYIFSDGVWKQDHKDVTMREWETVTTIMMDQARADDNTALMKWAKRSRSRASSEAALRMFKVVVGATISASDVDGHVELINTGNGEYNVDTTELQPHNRDHLMTRMVKANHDPEAQCPQWNKFMEQVLPDPNVRAYVQRAVGYSLFGRADQRAFFIVYGPSGTGKSQFLSTLEHVLGSYATTAAEGTLRAKETGGPNNDLHGLRGKRFVSTSETAENVSFNEVLLKRLTGRDTVVSRDLYQSNITWTPECTLWIATNHPPRFNSDDDAIWKRAKLIPFLTKFGTDAPEVSDFARRFLYQEADGILNWILAGLHDYLENGLGEPDAVVEAACEHRSQSDSVIRFLDDMLADGSLVESAEGQIRTKELYSMYEAWSRSSGDRGLGSRRFMNRLESSGRARYLKTNGLSVWRGLFRQGATNWLIQGELQDKA
jgi:putative DNA primase/helicase